MASDQSFVTHICDQAGHTGQISSPKMFGEYAIYCGGKVVHSSTATAIREANA